MAEERLTPTEWRDRLIEELGQIEYENRMAEARETIDEMEEMNGDQEDSGGELG